MFECCLKHALFLEAFSQCTNYPVSQLAISKYMPYIFLWNMHKTLILPFLSLLQLSQEIQLRQNEASRESRKKEKMERELKQLHVDLENKVAEMKIMQQGMQKNKEELQKLEQQLKEQKV